MFCLGFVHQPGRKVALIGPIWDSVAEARTPRHLPFTQADVRAERPYPRSRAKGQGLRPMIKP